MRCFYKVNNVHTLFSNPGEKCLITGILGNSVNKHVPESNKQRMDVCEGAVKLPKQEPLSYLEKIAELLKHGMV